MKLKEMCSKIFFSNLFICRMFLWRDMVILGFQIKTNNAAVTTKVRICFNTGNYVYHLV